MLVSDDHPQPFDAAATAVALPLEALPHLLQLGKPIQLTSQVLSARHDARTAPGFAEALLVSERGFGAITMEGVAARAGVSKALPYSHFENAEALTSADNVTLFKLAAHTLAALLGDLELAGKTGLVVEARALGGKVRQETETVIEYLRAVVALTPGAAS